MEGIGLLAVLLGLMVAVVMLPGVAALPEYYLVGDGVGWTTKNMNYTIWAQDKHFNRGDWLLFRRMRYFRQLPVVLEVNKTDFDNCISDHPLHNWTTTEGTEILLNETGTYYFISDNAFCLGGMKMAINVEGPPLQAWPPSSPVRIGSPVGNNARVAIAGGVAAGATLVIAVTAIALVLWRRRKPRDHFMDVPANKDPEVPYAQLQRFSLNELQVATDNFSDKNVLGRGGFGEVYKGRLADGSLVAVKRLREDCNRVGEQQFQTEIEMISMAVHKHLLRLRGFCMTPTAKMLVYPYMVNGCVASCLRDRSESRPPLDWQKRKRIALGSARGLAYLHDHSGCRIIHRDVKAANILLDEDFEAVVGDFGLARFMDYKDTHVSTVVRGTIGHIAPEYITTGKSTEKTDVFGYGMMLLELVTGKGAYHLIACLSDDDDGVVLLDRVKRIIEEKKLETIVDANIRGDYNTEEVEQLMKVALLCTQGSATGRPRMCEVIKLLEGVGLDERWEEWLKQEIMHLEFNHAYLPNPNRIIFDSTPNLQPTELSGPR